MQFDSSRGVRNAGGWRPTKLDAGERAGLALATMARHERIRVDAELNRLRRPIAAGDDGNQPRIATWRRIGTAVSGWWQAVTGMARRGLASAGDNA